MKRFLLIVVVLMLCACPAWALDVELTIDQVAVNGDAAPEMKNGMVFVPVRVVSEMLDAEVWYSGKEVAIRAGETKIRLTIGGEQVQINGEQVSLGAASYVKDGRTFVPVRFVGEALGCEVHYSRGKGDYVSIMPPYRKINDVTPVCMQRQECYTLGGRTQKYWSNLCSRKVYEILTAATGEDVTAPVREAQDYYGLLRYSFLDAYDRPIGVFSVHRAAFAEFVPQGALLFDEIADKWYAFDESALEDIGKWLDATCSQVVSDDWM